MRIEYIFPNLLILLNIGAAVSSAAVGDLRKFIYFAAAAVLNAAVTF